MQDRYGNQWNFKKVTKEAGAVVSSVPGSTLAGYLRIISASCFWQSLQVNAGLDCLLPNPYLHTHSLSYIQLGWKRFRQHKKNWPWLMQTDGLGHLSNYSSQLQNQFNATQPFTHLTVNYAFLTRFNTNSDLRALFRCPHSVLLSRFHVGILGIKFLKHLDSVHSPVSLFSLPTKCFRRQFVVITVKHLFSVWKIACHNF
jgi:hypothetical protein